MPKFKTNKALAVSTFVVFLLALPVCAGAPAVPAANAIWVEPSTVDLSTDTVSVGYKFNVTVWINLNVTSASWEFKMGYNKNYFNATRCGYTAGMKSQFFESIATIPLTPSFGSINATHSYVLHGETWGMMGPFREPGNGSLAWVEFQVMAVPAELQTFTLDICSFYPEDTYAQDPSQNKIPFTTCNNAVVIIPEFLEFMILAVLMSLTLVAYALSTKLRSPKNNE